ncbi:polysaccharide biosynthesis/export family protein [Tellurirhabdus bombi]|uniref:polysaccharide biosynthesis/export family protein n=1 Tax=Tellurirhabdus bombi TaxID=2907205 RepID=UPI001F3A81DD|nr:polysaccharide biosynthesis/export family protein [Tellurirhabdus bombi]
MRLKHGYLISLLLTLLSSCVSQKEIAYFQNKGAGLPSQRIAISNRYTPVIQAGDLLSIYVNSINPEASSIFNPYAAAPLATPPTQTPETASSLGYLVDNQGKVSLPLLGKVTLAGLTTAQAREQIEEKLKAFLKEPTVNIRFLNYKISVLGEVTRPSMFTIPNEQITLLEALSLAGDITIYGRRDNVLVIRETNGEREFARVNLTKRDLFQSPFYYLHPNDVIYVQPGKARAASADRFYLLIPAVASVLSLVAIIARR